MHGLIGECCKDIVYHSMYLMTIIMFSWRWAEEFCPSLGVSKLSSSAQGPGLGQSCGSGWLHRWSSLAGPAAASRRLGRACQGRDAEPGRWNKRTSNCFPLEKKQTTNKTQLAQLPYQDLIIADTRQGSVSHKTTVGSNFIRDININK